MQVKPDFNQPMNIRLEISVVGVQTVVVNPPPESEPLSVTDDEFGIRIRGINDNNPPLFVLDGKEISRSDFNRLDANKIGTISVLKDEFELEKYGEKGKNGVILITSKVSVPALPSFSLGSIQVPSDEKKKEKKAVFTIVEQMPQFPGGEKRLVHYISEYTKYPPQAKADKIEGTVVVGFVVSKTGRIENVKVVKSINPALDGEAVRVVISMPYWIPGKQNGLPVDVYYNIPIEFKLQNSGKETSESDSGMEDLQNQMVDLQEQMSDNQNKMAELQELSATAQNQNDDRQKQIANLHKQMPDVQKQMAGLQRLMEGSQNESADRRKQMTELRNRLTGLHQQMAGLHAQLGELHAQSAPALYRQIEEMPKFPGGETEMMKFLKLSLKYPVTANVKGITGSAFVLFIVDKNGKIANALVTNEIDLSLSAEALRVIKNMPDWTPGRQGGKPVNVACTIPIRFILQFGTQKSEEDHSLLKGDFPEVVVAGYTGNRQ
jgi:TonB family protein